MKFNCPYCQKLLEVPDNSVGRTGTCPKCGHKVRVPAPKPKPWNYDYPDLELEPEPEPIAPQRSYAWPDETVYPAPRRAPSTSASVPSEPSKAFGGFKACCLLVVILHILFMIVGLFASKSDTGQHAERKTQSPHRVSQRQEQDDEWEDYYGGNSEENYGLAKEALKGTPLGDGTVILRDGRIYNPSTGKVKRQRY